MHMRAFLTSLLGNLLAWNTSSWSISACLLVESHTWPHASYHSCEHPYVDGGGSCTECTDLCGSACSTLRWRVGVRLGSLVHLGRGSCLCSLSLHGKLDVQVCET